MAAGAITLQLKDSAGGGPYTVQFWSSNGLSSGLLTPMQTLMGLDGATLASASNPLPQVGPPGFNVASTPTIQNAAYAANNNVGGLLTIAAGSLASVLNNVTLSSKSGSVIAKALWLFHTNPSASTFTDKGTFSIAAADVSKIMCQPLQLTPQGSNGPSTTSVTIANLGLGLLSGGTFYAALAETAADTPASTTDLVLLFNGN
jgi:hypothetical protein